MYSPTTSPYGYSSFLKEENFRYYRLFSQSFPCLKETGPIIKDFFFPDSTN